MTNCTVDVRLTRGCRLKPLALAPYLVAAPLAVACGVDVADTASGTTKDYCAQYCEYTAPVHCKHQGEECRSWCAVDDSGFAQCPDERAKFRACTLTAPLKNFSCFADTARVQWEGKAACSS